MSKRVVFAMELRDSWLQILFVFIAIPVLIIATGPAYSIQCKTDADCGAPNMRCYHDYRGCDVGVCSCIYGVRDNGACVSKLEGDTCTSSDQCPRGLGCHENSCTCNGIFIDNNKYCLKVWEALLGSECRNGQTCLHKTEDGSGYTSSDVICLFGYCACRDGLKQDGSTCRRIAPEEHGCVTNTDCSGDSVCRSGSCKCPDGNRIVTRDPPKCGKWNAETGLDEGDVCDEIIYKNKFCDNSLECVRCGDDIEFRCRKYKSDRPLAASAHGKISSNYVLLTILTIFVSTRIYLWRET